MDMTPGFYQGRQRGLKSGRVSPRDAIRPSRSDVVDAAHGIVSTGSIDPHQGQLFNTNQIASVPHADIVRRAGGAAHDPLANHKGFMPGLASTRQKLAGLQRVGEARERTGASRGTGAPIKEAMEDRAAVMAQGHARDWYASRNAAGHLAAGEAGEMISGVAMRQGVSHGRAVRATAVTSPRTAWDIANAGPTGHSGGMSRPNLESAENVMSSVRRLGPDPHPDHVIDVASMAQGKALGTMKAKAGTEFVKGEPQRPIPVSSAASSKVPNFEQSLHLDNPSKIVQAQAARSYTVDVHDTRAMGGDEAMLKTPGGYHVAAMTGRRAALKAGELPPRGQSRSWEVIRGQQTPDSMGTHGLFVTNRNGAMAINPHARSDAASVRRDLHDGRSDTAKKYGLEF